MQEIKSSMVFKGYKSGTFLSDKDRGVTYGSKNFFLLRCRKLSPVWSLKVIIQEPSYPIKIEELFMARGVFLICDEGSWNQYGPRRLFFRYFHSR